MIKEIKIGDMVFKEGQIINGEKLGPVGCFYKIEKICPKIVKVRLIYWVTHDVIPRWEYGFQRHVPHEDLTNCVLTSKEDLDNHVYESEHYYYYE